MALVGGQLTTIDDDLMKKHPNYVLTSGVDLTSQAKVTIDGLVKQDFFGTSPKIGFLTYDSAAHKRAVTAGWTPALAAHDLSTTSTIEVLFPERSEQIADLSKAIAAAVLKFKAAGVDHVLFQDNAGLLAVLFMTTADAQKYTPAYGLNSQSAPGQIAKGSPTGGALVPASQLKGAKTVGWLPLTDINTGAEYPSSLAPCLTLLKQTAGNTEQKSFAGVPCSNFNLFEHVAAKAGKSLSSGTFLKELSKTGSSFSGNTATYETGFSASKHFGANVVRYGAFSETCACFEYSSPDKGRF